MGQGAKRILFIFVSVDANKITLFYEEESMEEVLKNEPFCQKLEWRAKLGEENDTAAKFR